MRMRNASASRNFTVLPPGQSALFAPYAIVNMSTFGIDALASDGAGFYVATTLQGQGIVDRVAPAGDPSLASPAAVSISMLALVHEIVLHEPSSLAYIGSSNGYFACKYTPSGGIDGTMCASFVGGSLPSNDVLSLLRVTAGGQDYLIVGTSGGLLLADAANGSKNGSKRMSNVQVTDIALGNAAVWLATSNGLYRYDYSGANPFNANPQRVLDAGTLTSVAVGTNAVWVGGASGIWRYNPNTSTWTNWRVSTVTGNFASLASDSVRDIAVARAVNIGGTARDIVWAATANGVSRFDASIPAITNFTTSDGLPSNNVQAVVIMPNGNKLFGTDAGVAVYTGP